MFSDNLKKLRNEMGISQKKLAEEIFVSQQTVAKWETDKSTPNPETLNTLATFFRVSVDYLTGNSALPSQLPKGVLIPVLGKVVAGIPIEAVEEIIDYEEITPEMATTGEHFALKVKGQSMEPKFSDGDVVIVRKQSDADTGDIVVALINGNDATLKKLKKDPSGITLIPTNPAYDLLVFSNKEIESLPVTIIGKVVELRAKF